DILASMIVNWLNKRK
ncbi:type I toxin-antitoxin system toxin Ldr family protein, partial [Escherichia coli]|nr:type I toxin-antitoxin system toxin Ldr family protein [Escherichia coli]